MLVDCSRNFRMQYIQGLAEEMLWLGYPRRCYFRLFQDLCYSPLPGIAAPFLRALSTQSQADAAPCYQVKSRVLEALRGKPRAHRLAAELVPSEFSASQRGQRMGAPSGTAVRAARPREQVPQRVPLKRVYWM